MDRNGHTTSHIFISYVHEDLGLANRIVDALAKNAVDTWVNWKSIPGGEDWQQEIYRGIEKADAFLFLISPDSVASEPCNKEIAHAVKNGKRILPIFIANVDDRGIDGVIEKFLWEEQKKEISRRQFIKCRDGQDDFNKAIAGVVETIHTDYEWLINHTKLQVKALEWTRNHGEDGFLLRGKELQNYWVDYIQGSGKTPQLTELQRLYILESEANEERIRKNEKLRQRRVITGLSLGLLVMVMLSILVWIQRNNALNSEATAIAEANARGTAQAIAETQTQIALARQLVAQAQYYDRTRNSWKMFAALLATESMKIFPSSEAAQILINNNIGAQLIARMAHNDMVMSVAFSPDGKYVLSGSDDGTARVWEATTGREITRVYRGLRANTVAFSPNGKDFVSFDCNPRIWETLTGKEVFPRPQHNDGCDLDVAAFSPDGKYLAADGCDEFNTDFSKCIKGNTYVWELTTGNVVAKMTHADWEIFVAFSPDSKYLVSGRCDKADSSENCLQDTAFLWEITTGREIAHMTHDASLRTVAFSPDGKYIVSAGDNTARVWEATTGKEVARTTHNDYVDAVAFSPDGKFVVSGSADGTARVWEASTGREIARMTHDGTVSVVAFSPDGQYVVSGSFDGTARVWEASSSIEVARMTHDGFVRSVAFSPDGQFVVSGSDDKSVRVWQAFTRKDLTNNGRILAFTFSQDGKYMISDSADNTIRVWEIATGKEVNHSHLNYDGVAISAAFSPDEKYVVRGNEDNTARVWEVATGKEIARVTHTDSVYPVTFSPDGKYVASTGDDTPRVWEAATGKEISQMTFGGMVSAIAFSPDGKYVIAGGDDKTVRVWETTTGKEITRITHDDFYQVNFVVQSIDVSRNSELVVSGGTDGIARVWEINSGKEVVRMVHDNVVTSVAFSPDGKFVVSGSADGTARVWEASTGREIARMTHDGGVSVVAFSPDGQYVVSGSFSFDARVWGTFTGVEVARMTHDEVVNSVAVSPDGKFVVSGSWDGIAHVWLWQPVDLIANACAYLPRNLTRAEWKQYIGDALHYQAVCPNLPIEPEITITPTP